MSLSVSCLDPQLQGNAKLWRTLWRPAGSWQGSGQVLSRQPPANHHARGPNERHWLRCVLLAMLVMLYLQLRV
jgi:hypothetical protein